MQSIFLLSSKELSSQTSSRSMLEEHTETGGRALLGMRWTRSGVRGGEAGPLASPILICTEEEGRWAGCPAAVMCVCVEEAVCAWCVRSRWGRPNQERCQVTHSRKEWGVCDVCTWQSLCLPRGMTEPLCGRGGWKVERHPSDIASKPGKECASHA